MCFVPILSNDRLTDFTCIPIGRVVSDQRAKFCSLSKTKILSSLDGRVVSALAVESEKLSRKSRRHVPRRAGIKPRMPKKNKDKKSAAAVHC